jgi:SAM-dependent methyltransferase
MTGVFGTPYAGEYDALYGTKDYAAECDVVEGLIRRHAARDVHELLDLGCGTGTHALTFAQRGYAVTGVDRSPAMLERARAKADAAHATVELVSGDIRTLRLGRTFDAVVMLFAVLGYQTHDADVTAAMRTVAAHLRPGGLLVCDVWYGPAVLAIGTSEREKIIDDAQGRLHRTASAQIDRERHNCRVDIATWRTAGGRATERSSEQHTMRYFFEPELGEYFRGAGLDLCAINSFDDIAAPPSETSWSAWVCGRMRAAP